MKAEIMQFLENWKSQFNSFMDFFLVALLAGAIMLLTSKKMSSPRFLIGSVLWGCTCGSIGAYFFEHPAVPIALTMGGVLTAPMTIARLQNMTLLDVVNEIKDRLEK